MDEKRLSASSREILSCDVGGERRDRATSVGGRAGWRCSEDGLQHYFCERAVPCQSDFGNNPPWGVEAVPGSASPLTLGSVLRPRPGRRRRQPGLCRSRRPDPLASVEALQRRRKRQALEARWVEGDWPRSRTGPGAPPLTAERPPPNGDSRRYHRRDPGERTDDAERAKLAHDGVVVEALDCIRSDRAFIDGKTVRVLDERPNGEAGDRFPGSVEQTRGRSLSD